MRTPVTPMGRGGLLATLVRAAPGTVLLVAAVVFLAAFVLVGAELWFGKAAGGALPSLLGSVPPGQRGLEFEQFGRLDTPGAAPLTAVTAAGDAIERSLPPGVAGIVGGRVDLVDTWEYQVLDSPVVITRLALRIQPGAEGAIRFAEGRAPTGRVTTVKMRDRSLAGDTSGELVDVTVVEAAISRNTSRELQLSLGDRLVLVPATSRHGTLVTDIVGVFDVIDPSDARWFSDTTLATPFRVQTTMDLFVYHAIGLLAPETYATLARDGTIGEAPLRYRWRFQVDPARAAPEEVEAMVAGLARLQAAYPYHGSSGAATDRPGVTSGVFGLIDQYRLQRRTAGTAFALAAIGPLAAGVGLLALAAAALARRRDPVVRLLRARGAGRARILAAAVVEAAIVAAVSAVLGTTAASFVTLGRADPAAALAATVAVAGVAFGLVVVADAATLRGSATARASGRGTLTGASPRRLVVDALVLAVAGAGVISLGSPGTGDALATSASGDLDPFVAGVPVLLAVAGGLVLLRLYGMAVATLGWLAAHGRGFSSVHAFRGLARGASRLDLAFVVVVLAVAAGVFSTSVAATLGQTQATVAVATVGADYRIAARGIGTLPPRLDLGALRAIGPLAVATETNGSLEGASLAGRPVTVTALDAAAYADVVRGSSLADGRFAVDLASAAARFAGAAAGSDQPLPVLVPAASAQAGGLGPGSPLSLVIGGTRLEAVVHAVEPELPGLARDTVVVPLDALRAALPDATGAATIAFLRASPEAAGAIETVLAPYASQVTLESADVVERGLRDAPLVATMRDGFLVALLVAAMLAAVVVGAAFAQALALRTREIALLRSLGLPARGAAAVVIAELGLTVAVAAGAGVALGLVIARLVVPDLGVERFAGTAVAAAVTVDLPGVLGAIAGPVLASLAVIVVIGLAVRAADVSATLRTGEA